jgi:hypothetical protein
MIHMNQQHRSCRRRTRDQRRRAQSRGACLALVISQSKKQHLVVRQGKDAQRRAGEGHDLCRQARKQDMQQAGQEGQEGQRQRGKLLTEASEGSIQQSCGCRQTSPKGNVQA